MGSEATPENRESNSFSRPIVEAIGGVPLFAPGLSFILRCILSVIIRKRSLPPMTLNVMVVADDTQLRLPGNRAAVQR